MQAEKGWWSCFFQEGVVDRGGGDAGSAFEK